MASKVARQKWFKEQSAEVAKFASKHGLAIDSLNRGYQLRLGGVIDIYPVNKRWHYLKTNDRGSYDSINDLDIAIFASPYGELKHIEKDAVDLTVKPVKLTLGEIWDWNGATSVKVYATTPEVDPDVRNLIGMIDGNDKHRRDTWPWYRRVWYKIINRRR